MKAYPPGTYQYLRDIGAFKRVKWCPRCFRMVSKWHDHHMKRGESVKADDIAEIDNGNG